MNHQYISVGRLKPGVLLEQVKAEFSAIMRRLAEEYPDNYRAGNEWIGALVEPLAQSDAFQVTVNQRFPVYFSEKRPRECRSASS